MKKDDIEKLGEMNNLKLNVFEKSEDNALSEIYVSENMKNVMNEENHQIPSYFTTILTHSFLVF